VAKYAAAEAGTDGAVTLGDTLLAGALVDHLGAEFDVRLNDSARLARAGFNQQGRQLLAAIEMSDGARGLLALGYDPDIRFASEVDRFDLVPELRRDPLRVETGASGPAGVIA